MGITAGPLIWLQELINGKKLTEDDLNVAKEFQRIKSLPDEEKLKLMDGIAEMVGGTAGAMAGSGIASIPAAGAGAVAGRSASRLIGKAAGLKETPRSAMDEAGESAKTFALNAAGEGLGRAVPVVANALPQAVKRGAVKAVGAAPEVVESIGPSNVAGYVRNLVRGHTTATPEADVLATLAGKYGVDLNLAQRSGQPWLQSVETVLDRSPFSSKKIRDFRQQQYGQFQGAINKYLDSLHAGQITMEDFARLTEQTFDSFQKQFNSRMSAGAEAAAKQLNPKPVSNIEAGEALKSGRDENLSAVRRWANKAYGKLRAEHGDRPVDISGFGDSAEALLSEIPEGQLANIFPPNVLKLLKASRVKATEETVTESIPKIYDDISKAQAGKLFSHLNPEEQASVRSMAERIGGPVETVKTVTEAAPPQVSMAEAMRVRSELLRRASTLSGKNSAQEARYLYSLADGINDAMEESLSKTPGAEKAFKELQRLNSEYRGYMEKLHPPAATGKAGSVAAGAIHSNQISEDLPGKLTGTETMIDQTNAAVSPNTVKATGEVVKNAVDPVQALRRNRFDASREAATVRNPATGESRLSPSALADELPGDGAASSLYGGQRAGVEGLAKPKLIAREEVLFNSPLAKSTESADAKRVFDSAFPKRGFGGKVQDTLDVFNEAGKTPQAQRAFAEGVLSQSETQMPTIGDEIRLNPRKLERTLNGYGETTGKVLGRRGEKTMDDFVKVGKGITEAEAMRGNASGTGRVSHAIDTATKLLRPSKYGELAAQVKAAGVGADVFTDPKKYGWMFEKPETLMGLGDNPAAGAAGRLAIDPPANPGPPDEAAGDFEKTLLDRPGVDDFENQLLARPDANGRPAPMPADQNPQWIGKGKIPAPPPPPPPPPQDAVRATAEAVKVAQPDRLTPMDEEERRKAVRPKF